MNPKICQDIFTISILAFVDCHLEIATADKSKEFQAELGGTFPFTVNFIYILGTDYNTSHTNFGFNSSYPTNSDPLGVLTNGVTITNETWNPQTPDVSNAPNAMLSGVYSATLNITNVQATFDALVALGGSGNARSNPTFGGILQYNQGV